MYMCIKVQNIVGRGDAILFLEKITYLIFKIINKRQSASISDTHNGKKKKKCKCQLQNNKQAWMKSLFTCMLLFPFRGGLSNSTWYEVNWNKPRCVVFELWANPTPCTIGLHVSTCSLLCLQHPFNIIIIGELIHMTILRRRRRNISNMIIIKHNIMQPFG